MTPEELMQIESYLLDRKKPDYELSKRIMAIIEDYNRQQAEIERLTLEYAGFRAAANQILDIDKLLGSIKADVISTINARLYAYKTNIYIKGEELIIIPSSDYELILKEMVGDAE